MDVHDPTKGIGPRSKALSSEQHRKFRELRERRLQLKNTQDVVGSGKKKRKRGKKGKHQASALEVAREKELPPDDRRSTIETAGFGKEERHVFAIDAGKGTAAIGESMDQSSKAPDSSFYQSSSQAGGQSNSVVAKGPSKIVPSQNPEVPGEEVASSARKKRKKLHWGLEIKERWERKGNM